MFVVWYKMYIHLYVGWIFVRDIILAQINIPIFPSWKSEAICIQSKKNFVAGTLTSLIVNHKRYMEIFVSKSFYKSFNTLWIYFLE